MYLHDFLKVTTTLILIPCEWILHSFTCKVYIKSHYTKCHITLSIPPQPWGSAHRLFTSITIYKFTVARHLLYIWQTSLLQIISRRDFFQSKIKLRLKWIGIGKDILFNLSGSLTVVSFNMVTWLPWLQHIMMLLSSFGQ